MNEKKNYQFIHHTACEYFPCHDVAWPEDFNCLFCYCPLYALGEECGGNPVYLENGIKDCSRCTFPHRRENYDEVNRRLGELLARVAKKDD